jgi:sugar (pentulose or hexulose) kinase
MTRDILLGIDAGASVIKAVAFSLAGEQIAVAARLNVYQSLGGGQVEQDMHRTWADCAAAAGSQMSSSPINDSEFQNCKTRELTAKSTSCQIHCAAHHTRRRANEFF